MLNKQHTQETSCIIEQLKCRLIKPYSEENHTEKLLQPGNRIHKKRRREPLMKKTLQQQKKRQDKEPSRKKQKTEQILKNQTKYNNGMIQQTRRKQEQKQPKFKISDMVSVKIDKVDKTTLSYPNMLLGKIIEIKHTGCIKIVTVFGKVNTLISPSLLYLCMATNVTLDYTTEISFTSACKKASGLK